MVKKLIIILFSIVIVTSAWAVFSGDSTLFNPSLTSISSLVAYLTLLVSIFLLSSKKIFDKRYIYLTIPLVLYFLVTTLNRYTDKEYLNLTNCLLTCIFLLFRDDMKSVFYKVYYIFFTVISAYGIVCYLTYSVGLHLIPFRLVEYYTTNADFYIDFYACTSCIQGSTIRFCGLYNEPGFWGTIAALILCAEDLDLRKLPNILILIGGAFTFSFAFWVILVVYYVFSRGKIFYTIMVLSVLAVLYFFVLPNIETGNEAIDELIGRLAYEDGQFAGDNRSNANLDYLFDSTLSSDKFFFGHGGGYIAYLDMTGISSYKTSIVEYGVVGFLLMYGVLLFVVLKYGRKCHFAWPFILVFFLSIYQRPGIFTMVYMVVLFYGLDRRKKASVAIPEARHSNSDNLLVRT